MFRKDDSAQERYAVEWCQRHLSHLVVPSSGTKAKKSYRVAPILNCSNQELLTQKSTLE